MFKGFVVTIDAEPKGKARPRFVSKGGFVRTYTPKPTKTLEDLICVCVKSEMNRLRIDPAEQGVPILMDIEAHFVVPESWSKKKKAQALSGEISPTKKPDCDNVGKLVADALNGVAYHDDAQIVEMRIRKRYATESKIQVSISPIATEKNLDESGHLPF